MENAICYESIEKVFEFTTVPDLESCFKKIIFYAELLRSFS